MPNIIEYASRYNDGVAPTHEDINARQAGLKAYGIRCCGEVWVAGYGWTALYYGPAVDKDTQNLLCVGKVKRTGQTATYTD